MLENLFRRQFDLSQAQVRLARIPDLPRLSRLLVEAERRYYNMESGDLPRLLEAMPVILLESNGTLLGTVIPGWREQRVTWLRGVGLLRGVHVADALHRMLDQLHYELVLRGLREVYYAGEDTADTWLLPLLKTFHYEQDAEVVVYEKHSLNIPAQGNLQIALRPVQLTDLAELMHLDALCFEPQWRMHEAAMVRAIGDDGLFLVASTGERLLGYCYATRHFGGRLIHLVRIAVDPYQQCRGIGTRLMAETVAYARSHHADLLTLNTQSYNVRAQRLYRWFGFVPNGERQIVLRGTL